MQPYYSIQQLYLFPNYRTREDYRSATGKDAPAYDPSRPPKYWFDPAAVNSTQRLFAYENAYFVDSRPLIDALILKREEAAAVNIYEPGIDKPAPQESEVAIPMRELKPNEEIVYDPLGNPVVHDKSVAEPAASAGFTEADRALLHAIAAKLGLAA